jgi:hypothetical protein
VSAIAPILLQTEQDSPVTSPRLFTVLISWLALALGPTPVAQAADGSTASPPAIATITGRVLNATNGLYLNNARVAVEGTDLVQFTNEAGEYRIDDAPAGNVRLKVNYTGLDPQAASVATTPNASVETTDLMLRA